MILAFDNVLNDDNTEEEFEGRYEDDAKLHESGLRKIVVEFVARRSPP